VSLFCSPPRANATVSLFYRANQAYGPTPNTPLGRLCRCTPSGPEMSACAHCPPLCAQKGAEVGGFALLAGVLTLLGILFWGENNGHFSYFLLRRGQKPPGNIGSAHRFCRNVQKWTLKVKSRLLTAEMSRKRVFFVGFGRSGLLKALR